MILLYVTFTSKRQYFHAPQWITPDNTLGNSTHASLVDLVNKPLLFFSYKDTFHILARRIIVDTKLSSGSGKTNT